MLGTSVLLLALAAVGLAQVPEGYRTVYITSNVDPKFVIVAKARTAGSTTIVYVSLAPQSIFKHRDPLTQAFHRYSQTRKSTPEQQWYIKNNATKIQLAGTTLCMDGGAKGELGMDIKSITPTITSEPRDLTLWRHHSQLEGYGQHLRQRVRRDRVPELVRHGRRPYCAGTLGSE